MTTVIDSSGKIKYTIVISGLTKIVRDASGKTLGFIKNNKTYDAAGNLVSHGEDISAIFK